MEARSCLSAEPADVEEEASIKQDNKDLSSQLARTRFYRGMGRRERGGGEGPIPQSGAKKRKKENHDFSPAGLAQKLGLS